MELIVLKDEKKRLVTGPVAIPDCPDCDYPRGEKLLTVDEIESMVHFYNTHSQLSDEMHVYGATQKSVGVAVENWTLKEPLITKNTQGRQVVLPKGTWMTTIKVTDDDTWRKIQDGTYKGFSASYMSEEAAKEVLAAKRTLIADLENPMPVTVSIVDEPCVFDAIFCSIKDDPEAVKAGRKISNATLKKIQDAFDNIKTLINDALTERGQIEADKENDLMEDVSMNEDELKTMVIEAVKEALKEPEPEEEELVEEMEEKPEPEAEEEVEEMEELPPSEAEMELEKAQKRIKELEDKLGEGESQSIKGQDDTPEEEPVQKFRVEEGRDIYGRKIA